jgi:hypothetical protein
MKKLKLLSVVGITLIALTTAGWAAGRGGGGGGFHGGGGFGGGHFGGFQGGGGRGGGHFGGFRGGGFGGGAIRGGGFSGARFSSGVPRFSRGGPRVSSLGARQSQTTGRNGLNRSMGRIAERHDANWHRDWDRHRGHFFHNRFFVFDDGYWFGLDPYDYYAYDDYPYDDQDYYGYDTSTDPYSVSNISTVQSELARQGYYHGVIDGVYGAQTRTALTRYQSRHGLQATGSLTQATLQSLGTGS